MSYVALFVLPEGVCTSETGKITGREEMASFKDAYGARMLFDDLGQTKTQSEYT